MAILDRVFFWNSHTFQVYFLPNSVLNDETLQSQELNLIWGSLTDSGSQETWI